MPKIRALKPSFFTDEDVVEVPPLARLLFAGIWCHACDNGHIQDKPKQMKLRILPADDCDVDALLDELASVGLIERRDGWVIVPTLTEHQKPDKRYFLTCGFPGCSTAKPTVRTPEPDEDSLRAPRAHDVTPTSARRDPGVTTRSPSTDGDGDGDGDGDLYRSPVAPRRATSADADGFNDWWTNYPRKVGKGQARRAYTGARKKTDAATLLDAIGRFAEQHKGTDPRFIPHPATWLNGERWLDAADEPPTDPWEAFRGYDPDAPTQVHP